MFVSQLTFYCNTVKYYLGNKDIHMLSGESKSSFLAGITTRSGLSVPE